MYVCMYVCMCVCVYVCIYVCWADSIMQHPGVLLFWYLIFVLILTFTHAVYHFLSVHWTTCFGRMRPSSGSMCLRGHCIHIKNHLLSFLVQSKTDFKWFLKYNIWSNWTARMFKTFPKLYGTLTAHLNETWCDGFLSVVCLLSCVDVERMYLGF
jgi:hypothetical protein